MLHHRLEALGAGGPDVAAFVESGSMAEVALRVIERFRPQLVVLGAVDAERIARHVSVPIVGVA